MGRGHYAPPGADDRRNSAPRGAQWSPRMQPPVTRRGWLVGVDLGGTHVRVAALDPRGRRRELRYSSPGLAGLFRFLRTVWRRWRLTRADVDSLVIASRGVWTAAERRRQARRARALARAVRVISDVEAAYLGALGDAPGVLLLAGTGAMVLGRDARGRWVRAGGWGPLLGDEGSAFWIGREWLRATMDGRGFGLARRALASADPVARIAALAPGILQRAWTRSRLERRIAEQGQSALADLVARAASALRLPAPLRVSWAGGLLADRRYRAGVWRAARQAGLAVAIEAPRESPSAAALRLAGRLDQPALRRGARPARRPRQIK